jgi:hypothetical protein
MAGEGIELHIGLLEAIDTGEPAGRRFPLKKRHRADRFVREAPQA